MRLALKTNAFKTCELYTLRLISTVWSYRPTIKGHVIHHMFTKKSCQQLVTMIYTTYMKQRILFFHTQGYRPSKIQKLLWEENLTCSRVGVYKLQKNYKETRSIRRKGGSGRWSKITVEIKKLVEERMRSDDETTAYQLHRMLTEKGYSISLRTILRRRTALGWWC